MVLAVAVAVQLVLDVGVRDDVLRQRYRRGFAHGELAVDLRSRRQIDIELRWRGILTYLELFPRLTIQGGVAHGHRRALVVVWHARKRGGNLLLDSGQLGIGEATLSSYVKTFICVFRKTGSYGRVQVESTLRRIERDIPISIVLADRDRQTR